MNRTQKIIIILAMVVLTVIVLFPPCLVKYSGTSVRRDVRYLFIFVPFTGKTGRIIEAPRQSIPGFRFAQTVEEKYQVEKIEMGRMLLEILAVCFIAGGIIITTSKTRNSALRSPGPNMR